MRAAVYWFLLVNLVSLSLLQDVASMPSIKAMALADAERVPPAWLQPLLEKNFFEDCPNHPLSNCNFFCTVCSDRAICTGCLPDHPGHQVIQVR